ncbi:MAG: rhomboid family intramembrane serine protease [Candidatus Pacearchaeota archaeon]
MRRSLRYYTERNLKSKSFEDYLGSLSATNLIIFINVIFFIIATTLLIINESYINYIALKPSNIMQGKYIWTLITSMFMHAPTIGPFILSYLSFHLIINMFVLFSLGNFCEKIIGKKRFIWFYLISGIFAGIFSVIFSYFFTNSDFGIRIFGDPSLPGVGASGAIFAIAGLFVVLTPKLRFMIVFLPFFSLPAYIMVPLVLFATWLVSAGTNLPIGNTAHFGGFIIGVIYGIYLRKKYYNKIIMLNRRMGIS